MTDAEQVGLRIANSLTGYIAHVQGSYTCRHCELAQELADALLAATQQGGEAERERIIEMLQQFRRNKIDVGASIESLQPIEDMEYYIRTSSAAPEAPRC